MSRVGEQSNSGDRPELASCNRPRVQVEVILRSSATIVGPFDPMELADATGGRPLSAMAYWAISQSGLTADLGICGRTLIR